MSLEYPLLHRWIASLIGWVASLVVRTFFRLPDPVLAFVFRLLVVPVRALTGDSPETRAVVDIAYVFGRGGEGAAIFRRVLTDNRNRELVGIVRGALLRSWI